MKKISALFAVLLLLFTFASCGKTESFIYSSQTDTVTEGLYRYYISDIKSSPEAYKLTVEDTQAIRDKAAARCKEYLAAIELMRQEGITLSAEFKRLAAENTESIWNLFGTYYQEHGISKQDITAAQTHKSRLLQLLDYYYGADGKDPVSEDAMKEKFVDIYVGFKAIEGNLYRINDKNEKIPFTEKEEKEITRLFEDMAKRINDGSATVDELNEEYNSSQGIIVTSPLSVLLTKEGDPMYDDSFFSEVYSVSHGNAKVIKSGSSIYVIQRATIATDDEDAFMLYRSEILQNMRMGKIEKKLSNFISTMTIEENTRLIESIG